MRCLAVLVVVAGCRVGGVFECQTSEQCREGTMYGICEAEHYCSLPDSRCPSGSRYADAAPDQIAGLCVPDADRDGFYDNDDNCPTVKNIDQGNEDGDRFGDACDPCPPVNDDNPPDADGDGVADACDPRPGMADTIVAFEGFHTGLPSSLLATGTWTAAGDNVGISGDGNLVAAGLPGSGQTYVTAAFTVTPQPVDGTIGVFAEFNAGNGIICELEIKNNGTSNTLKLINTANAVSMTTAYPAGTGAFELRIGWDRTTNYDCHAGTRMVTGSFMQYAPAYGALDSNFASSLAWVMVVAAGR